MKKQIYSFFLFVGSQLLIAQNVNLNPAYYLLFSDTNQPPITQHVIFEENFDDQEDWQTLDKITVGTIPKGWTAARTNENWHPTSTPSGQPSMLISGNDPNKVYGNTGKSLITYSESSNGWTSDGILTVDIAPVDEIYIEFKIKFQPGFASNSEGGQIKMFRILHFDDGGSRYNFFSDGSSAPIYIFDWAQSAAYGVRQFHSFRCDDQENNYYCTNPTISGSSRQINSGDIWHKMSFYLHLNSAPGAEDGILKVRLDGHPITDMDKIAWIGRDGDINAKWNSISFGGNDYYHFNLDSEANISDRERWYAFDDIKVLDTFPIGEEW